MLQNSAALSYPEQPTDRKVNECLLSFVVAPMLARLKVSIQAAIAHIVGRLVSEIGCPQCVVPVVKALLNHVRQHSDRVWPSRVRLAELAEVSTRTIDRGLAWLRAHGWICYVTGEDLLNGPGPHQYTGRCRGAGPVNTYDIGKLASLLPGRWISQSNPTDNQHSVTNSSPPATLGEHKRKARMAAVAALVGLGLWVAVARKIVASRGAAWALQLAQYARAQPELPGPGWIARTAATWDSWPDWFTRKLEADHKARGRIVIAPSGFARAVMAPEVRAKADETRQSAVERLRKLPGWGRGTKKP